MSIASLSTSYAEAYVNAPARQRAGAPPGGGASNPTNTNPPADILKSLAAYIPSEVLTVYIAGIAAMSTANTTADKNAVINWFFIACATLSVIFGAVGVWVTADSAPPLAAWAFPALASGIAFVAYALALPNGFFGPSAFGTLTVLIVTPLLHACSLVYNKLFPPPKV